MNKLLVGSLISIAIGLSGCSNQNVNNGGSGSAGSRSNQGPTTGTVASGGASGVDSRSTFNYLPGSDSNVLSNSASNTNDISLAGLKDPNNLLSQRIIYFDYNKSTIRPEYMVLINTHAQLLAKYPNLTMRLEGHADERGSREYNVALSDARAQSVKRIMGVQGATSRQIKTIGYGEEMPIVRGHDKRSWQKNRRVEIKYNHY